MRRINILYAIFIIAITSLLGGCKQEPLIGYTGGNTVGFWIHSVNHSLLGKSVSERPLDTLVLDIAATGRLADYDRKVSGSFIPDPEGTATDELKNTAVEGRDYRILGGEIKAGEMYGKFRVEIINSDRIVTEDLKLNLTLTANDDFELGIKENQNIRVTFSQRILQPVTWRAMRFFFCAVYSTQVYKVFMEVTGLTQFYYYEGEVSSIEGRVMGRNFGNYIRAYNEANPGKPMLHDDGTNEGLPIVPIH